MIVSFTLTAGKTSDTEKIDYIYREFFPLMRSVAGEILTGGDAEDAVHDAMIKIIKNASVIDVSDRKKVRNLCCIIARNCAIDRLRKRDGKNVPLSEIPEDAEDTEPLPEEAVVGGDTVGAVLSAIGKLPEIYRDPCVLKYFHDYRDKEIAALLGIPGKTVNTRIRRGKMLLREALRKEGYHE